MSCVALLSFFIVLFFFFNDPAPPEIYTLSLHDALPICWFCRARSARRARVMRSRRPPSCRKAFSNWRSCWSSRDRKSTRLNSSHTVISYAVFCLKKKKTEERTLMHREYAELTDSGLHAE